MDGVWDLITKLHQAELNGTGQRSLVVKSSEPPDEMVPPWIPLCAGWRVCIYFFGKYRCTCANMPAYLMSRWCAVLFGRTPAATLPAMSISESAHVKLIHKLIMSYVSSPNRCASWQLVYDWSWKLFVQVIWSCAKRSSWAAWVAPDTSISSHLIIIYNAADKPYPLPCIHPNRTHLIGFRLCALRLGTVYKAFACV